MSKSVARSSVSTAPTTSHVPTDSNREPNARRDRASAGNPSAFEFLLAYRTHFLIDDSQLMFGDNWQRAKEALLAAAVYCSKHHADGFSVSFLHHESSEPDRATNGFTNLKSEAAVLEIFDRVRTAPGNSKPTGQRLKAILNDYTAPSEVNPSTPEQPRQVGSKPLKVIIITEGIPTDDITSVLTSVVPQTTTAPSDPQPTRISIEFWQVGRNARASHFFYKTGMLRPIPTLTPTSETNIQPGRKWKYDADEPRKAGPSNNFAKFMFVNMLQSRFMRTSRR